MKKNIEKLRELAYEVAGKLGYGIYSIKLTERKGTWFLIIAIDRDEGTVSLDDCQKFSRKFEQILDELDFLNFTYNLIIESPGVERELRTIRDFERFTGNLVKIVFNEPIEKRIDIIGKLASVKNEEITIIDRNTGEKFPVDFNKIKRANLKLEL